MTRYVAYLWRLERLQGINARAVLFLYSATFCGLKSIRDSTSYILDFKPISTDWCGTTAEPPTMYQQHNTLSPKMKWERVQRMRSTMGEESLQTIETKQASETSQNVAAMVASELRIYF